MMMITLLTLIAITTAEIEEEIEEFNHILDEKLQDLRWNLMKKEGDALKHFDYSFFNVYNEITDLFLDPYENQLKKWQKLCSSSFLRENFRASYFCNDMEYFTIRVARSSTYYLKSIYNGGILTDTMMEINGANFYSYAIERLEFVVPMYHYNQSCVELLLPNLLDIYETFNNRFFLMANSFKKLLPRAKMEYKSVVERNIFILNKAFDEIENCVKTENSTGCFDIIVNYQCTSFKDCGIAFKLFQSIKEIYRILDSNTRIHFALLNGRVFRTLVLAEHFHDYLINWENEVEECLKGKKNSFLYHNFLFIID